MTFPIPPWSPNWKWGKGTTLIVISVRVLTVLFEDLSLNESFTSVPLIKRNSQRKKIIQTEP